MKTSKRMLAALAAALLLSGCGAGAPSERSRVAMIVKSTTTEFWRAVFTGAEAAAVEYNLELTILGPETEEDFETQNEMIAEAVENGAEALVFSAIDFEGNAAAIESAAAQGVKIVVIDSDVNADSVAIYIGTDNYAAGRMAAEAALQRGDGPLTVGLVNYDVNSANGQLREQGARDALEESGRAVVAAVINTMAEAESACADTLRLLEAHPEINVLIAFNEPTSVGAARALAERSLQDTVSLVGFDSNVETVDALQTGVVDALIVQNTYAMGYLGVESAYKLLAGQAASQPSTVDTSTRIIDRNNMFTIDGQKTLFAFE
ncbi:MAG: substrate-binding domain-containing protein [Gemmiger sp.]